jgi:hypothetical protein
MPQSGAKLAKRRQRPKAGAIVTHGLRLVVCAMLSLIPATALAQRERAAPKIVSSQTIHSGDALLQVDFGEGPFDLPQAAIVQRVQNVADAVGRFYGHFPVKRTRIVIFSVAGRHGVLQGTTWGNRDGFAAYLRIRIGSATTAAELVDDWILTHEMVHTALSSLPDDQHWFEEGLASYIEPFVRMAAGEMSPETTWTGMVRGMPNGEPAAGDAGLNHTHTWGRTYWGGALFCLVADVKIRRETENRTGLPDALRAIVAAGGTIDTEMPLSQVLAIGDRATNTNVLEAMYRQWDDTPVNVDLPSIWKELGVRPVGDAVVFEAKAPLAAVRLAMTRSVPGSSLVR